MTEPTTNRKPFIIVGLGFLVIFVLGLGVYLFFGGDEPAEVDLETAKEQIDEEEVGTTVPGPLEIDGTWAVANANGEVGFDEAPSGSFVGFRVEEELVSVGSKTAVGRTANVSGELTISGTTLETTMVEADMSELTTDRSQRDSRVQSALDTDEFPTAVFELTEPVDLGEEALDAEAVSVSAVGELTIHGVTNEVTMELDAQIIGTQIVVVGKTEIDFTDYDVEAPTSGSVLSVSDDAVIELQLFFDRNG